MGQERLAPTIIACLTATAANTREKVEPFLTDFVAAVNPRRRDSRCTRLATCTRDVNIKIARPRERA